MPLLASCSSLACDYTTRLQDNSSGVSLSIPEQCPRCASPLLTSCPKCGFPLLENPNPQGRCEVCHAVMRGAIASR
jgi:hypothetical protein